MQCTLLIKLVKIKFIVSNIRMQFTLYLQEIHLNFNLFVDM